MQPPARDANVSCLPGHVQANTLEAGMPPRSSTAEIEDVNDWQNDVNLSSGFSGTAQAKPSAEQQRDRVDSKVSDISSKGTGRGSSKTSHISQVSRVSSAVVSKVLVKVDPLTCTVMTAGAILASSAGMVNVIAFYALGTYVSHVTGTLTGVGRHAQANAIDDAGRCALLVMSFIMGSTICGCLIARSTVSFGYAMYGFVLLGNALLLIIVALCWETDVAPYLCAAACGLQNGMATSYSGAVIRTTHVTGIATDIGLICGRTLVALIKRRLCGNYEALNPLEEGRKLMLLIILGVSFVAGVLLGAALYTAAGVHALYVPAGITGIAGSWYTFYRIVLMRQPVVNRISTVAPAVLMHSLSLDSRPKASSDAIVVVKVKGKDTETVTAPDRLPEAAAKAKTPEQILSVLEAIEDPIANLVDRHFSGIANPPSDMCDAHRRLKAAVLEMAQLRRGAGGNCNAFPPQAEGVPAIYVL